MKDYAILTDSGTDTPFEVVNSSPVYTIPLQVIFQGQAPMSDSIDISSKEVAQRLAVEVPKTSLPPLDRIGQTIEKIRADGYQKVLVITISARLSGTLNAIEVVAQNYRDMEFHFIDSKNIGMGAGMLCILAARCLKADIAYKKCAAIVEQHVERTKVFFAIPTLKYLSMGGRIGKVASLIGMALHVVPVITCDENGEYVVAGKSRKWNQALKIAQEKIIEYVTDQRDFALAVVESQAEEEAGTIEKVLFERLPHRRFFYRGGISPALTVHTGPKLIGVGAQILLPTT